ncbi:Synaptotagmin-9 [Nymphon striatum]|nr:Synaptotagmin-9 [Nymphon striatum]
MERYNISADEIEPELYMSEGDESANSRTTGLGKVGFSFQYNVIRQQLCVKVIGATGLPAKFVQKGTANPFVKLVLHPEKSPKYLTKVQRNTSNPVFQEMFVFPAKIDTINTRILNLTVWDYDKFTRKVPIGGISVPLADMGITPNLKEDLITDDMWRDLSSRETEKQARGELMFSISFKPQRSILTVVIIKTKSLQWSDVRGEKEHVYVKIRIMEGKKLIKSRKTPAVRRRSITEFDYTLTQFIPHATLNDVTINLYVYIKSGFSGKQLIGRTQVGNNPDVMDQGVHHWIDMLDAPRSTVAQWHSIY